MTSDKLNLYDYDIEGLRDLITEWGFPRYRADQVWGWLYTQKVADFASMGNISPDLKAKLEELATIAPMEVAREMHSFDGETHKYLFRLPDGQLIETVLMSYSGVRRTACISTQAGCAMGCVFCATGQMGFARNLSVGEIVAQTIHVARILEAEGERLSNVVFMGMGEPFHNYDASLDAVHRLMDEKALGIGARHITVSTVGLPHVIRRFADEGLQVNLAISLHAATDKERRKLIPINKKFPLADLMDSVRYYIEQAGRRVTFEWAAIAGENDTPEQAHALGELLRGLMCHVNIIPLNHTEGYSGRRTENEGIDEFVAILESYHIPATVRVRRGIDINAGCGQLKTAVIKDG